MAPSWLNSKFVEETLQPNNVNHRISVKNVKVEPAVSKGNNFMGTLLRVNFDITTDENDTNGSLIIKTMPEGEYVKAVIESAGFLTKEIQMYSTVLPIMYKMAAAKLANYQVTPEYYTTPKEDVLVLEDLKSQGYCMKVRHLQLDLEHSQAAISALGKLHGMSIAMDICHPEIKENFLDHYSSSSFVPAAGEFIDAAFKSLVKKFENWKGQEHFLPKIRKLSETVVERLAATAKPGPLMVMTHGDFWVNNILFRYSGNKITDVRMIDFQFTRWASPASDLYYFIFSSVQEQVRVENSAELLATYQTTLFNTLTAMGYSEKVFSLEQLRQEMKDKMFYGLVYACLTMCVTLSEPEGVMDMDVVSLQDQAEGSANPIALTKFSPQFIEVFPKVLKYFEEKGVL